MKIELRGKKYNFLPYIKQEQNMSATFIYKQEANLTYHLPEASTEYHSLSHLWQQKGTDYVNYGMFGHCSFSLPHYQ